MVRFPAGADGVTDRQKNNQIERRDTEAERQNGRETERQIGQRAGRQAGIEIGGKSGEDRSFHRECNRERGRE